MWTETALLHAWISMCLQGAGSPVVFVPGGEKLRRTQKAPSLDGAGRPLPLSGQTSSRGAAGHLPRGWGSGGGKAKRRAAVVIACSSLRVCGEGAGI